MKLTICEDARTLGQKSAALAAELLNTAIENQGYARLVLSTGASQFETLEALVNEEVDWSKVEVFHLDEYVGLSETHPASFRKYIKERFEAYAPVKKIHFVDGSGDIKRNIAELTAEIRKSPIDLALIGIGENAHVAFNDPPADFENQNAYIVVNLDERCRMQQTGEGWFARLEDVPKQAISMTVSEIMKSKVVISSVPHAVKAQAIKATIEHELTPDIPATILKQHVQWFLFVDNNSASLIRENPFVGA